LLDLVGHLDRLSGRPLRVDYAGWRPGDQRIFVCDIRKARRELDWWPRVSSPEGVERLYRWIEANRALFSEDRRG
jgi:CDP-paratose 2-epimerase